MALKPGFFWKRDKGATSLHDLKLGGARITGELAEMMHYASKVEFGEGTMSPRPHMGPAFMDMIRKAAPIMGKIARRAISDRLTGKKLLKILERAMAGAMYEMEALRVNYLRNLVYYAERYARQRQEGYTGYVLTENLFNNRMITVLVEGIVQSLDEKGYRADGSSAGPGLPSLRGQS